MGFIIRFLVVYAILTVAYRYYLAMFGTLPDTLTTVVANQSKWLLEIFGYRVAMVQDHASAFYQVWLNGRYVARVIEGCNAVSVLILFVTFIMAFKGTLKHTVVFGLLGVVVIYSINLLRIALLVVGVYTLPTYAEVLHSLIFPAIIYGTMFLLWVVWVRQFAKR